MEHLLLKRGFSDEDCGCPEEEWVMHNTHVTIHLEPDGSGHAFFDTGDWDTEHHFDVSTMPDLRTAASDFLLELYGDRQC